MKKYWAKKVGINEDLTKVFYKKNIVNTNRKNIGEDYFGILKVKVKKSTDLNRKIEGWVRGIENNI